MTTDYPKELDESLLLADGSRLRIRALRPNEEGSIRDLYSHLSPRTRYLRFFSPMPALPYSLLRRLASVDYRHQLALVAEHQDASHREIVGLASFGAVGDRTAEVALVVRDDWQQRRVGTALASRVLRAAERRGYERFIVHMLSDNAPIRRILARVGEVVSATVRGGVSELVLVRRHAADLDPTIP